MAAGSAWPASRPKPTVFGIALKVWSHALIRVDNFEPTIRILRRWFIAAIRMDEVNAVATRVLLTAHIDVVADLDRIERYRNLMRCRIVATGEDVIDRHIQRLAAAVAIKREAEVRVAKFGPQTALRPNSARLEHGACHNDPRHIGSAMGGAVARLVGKSPNRSHG